LLSAVQFVNRAKGENVMRNNNTRNAPRREFFSLVLLTAAFTCIALLERLV
jgi:hypothetical protein